MASFEQALRVLSQHQALLNNTNLSKNMI